MLVSEFINLWNTYFKSNMPMCVTFNNTPTTIYNLLYSTSNLKSFELEFKLDSGLKSYNIYSDVYDLDEVSWDTKKIINTLQIETYDNIYTNTLILHLKGE